MKIIDAQAYHLKAPLEIHYKTTFGSMTHRQAVFIVVTSEDGISGVGETYINFPVWAPYGRLAAYREAFFPQVVGKDIDDIPLFMQSLWKLFYRASMQGNCLGSTIQAMCAISTALWDMAARQKGVPLRVMFAGNPANKVKIYGSGVNTPFPIDALKDGLDMGMDIFKLKLGYGDIIDKKNIEELKRILGSGVRLAVDVNRSWSFEQTVEWMDYLADNDIAWIEEPLDPESQHRYPELIERATIPVSGGENFLIPPDTDFRTEKEWGLDLNETQLTLDIIQPAIVKNCCFSDAVQLLKLAEERDKKIYPHFLGSAPGMAASAQLASLTKYPHLEWDINPNPMRTSCFIEPFRAENGYLLLNDNPGIGWEIRPEIFMDWTVGHVQVTG
ncbi:MAG: mandelate racemase/muconate lactonizing enzyme family protein [Candidatus Latescibacteria bacterium]|nr:mandelate racemase/muconate lactonizing enzyme family protein [Candidatus Latescibacterota bacterium]